MTARRLLRFLNRHIFLLPLRGYGVAGKASGFVEGAGSQVGGWGGGGSHALGKGAGGTTDEAQVREIVLRRVALSIALTGEHAAEASKASKDSTASSATEVKQVKRAQPLRSY